MFTGKWSCDLIAFGPVDGVQISNGQIEILGQVLQVPRTSASHIGDALVGKIVAAFGEVKADGSYAVSAIRVSPSG